MKLSHSSFWLFSLVLIVTLSFLLPSLSRADEKEFKVGLLLCLTGGCAEPGNNALKGLQLAAEELNAQGGVLGKKITFIVEDSREGDGGAHSVSGYQKLGLHKDIQYLVGPTWTVGGLPLVPLVSKRSDVIMTSPSLGVADFNEAADHMFNVWPHDSYSTEGLAEFAMKRGWRRAAVFSNQGPWESAQAKVFAAAFKRLGGEVVAFEEPVAEGADLKGESLRIKSKNPDVVFMSNYTQMDTASRELQKLHYQGKIMAILMDETRIKNAAGALDGAFFARYADPGPDFISKFQKKFSEKPGIAADTGYDVLKLYAAAIEAAKTFDPSIVKKGIQASKFRGASGEIVFDAHGGVVKRPQFWIVKDGKQELLATEP